MTCIGTHEGGFQRNQGKGANKKKLDSTCLLWFVNISNFKISMPPGTQHEFKHRVKP